MVPSEPIASRHQSKLKCSPETSASPLDFYHALQNIGEHFGGRLVGVDVLDEVLAVKFQHRLGFFFVSLEPVANDLEAGVIEAIFLERAALQALDEIIEIGGAEIKNPDDVQGVLEHLSLVRIARDAVQHERVGLGIEPAGLGRAQDGLPPQVNGRFVGNEFTAARIIDKGAADFAFDGEVAKNVTAGAVKKVRDVAEDFSLSAFAGAGRAEQKNRAVFHAIAI